MRAQQHDVRISRTPFDEYDEDEAHDNKDYPLADAVGSAASAAAAHDYSTYDGGFAKDVEDEDDDGFDFGDGDGDKAKTDRKSVV